jgi:uncharacterized protein (TIRG00374 family)
MILALLQLGDLDLSRQTLSRVSPVWYSLAIISFYASIVARGWRWQKILTTMGYRIGFVYTTALLTAGLFLNAILPARAGEIGRVAMLRQDHAIPVSKGLASIASERALDVFAILVMAIVSGWLALAGRLPPEVLNLLTGVTLLLVLALIGLLVVPGLEHRLRDWSLLRKILPNKLWLIYQRVLNFGFSLIDGVRLLGRRPVALLIVLAQSFFIWVWDGIVLYFILLSLGIVEPFNLSLFTAMVSALVTAVPLTPGALGQYDATLISLLALFGISVANASLVVLLLRLVQLWTFIPISGIITYIFGFSRVLNLGPGRTETPVVADNQRLSPELTEG